MMSSERSLSPSKVLEQVAEALPSEARPNVIIIGSLAAGYHFFGGNSSRAIRTKDVDCLFSPHSKAISTAAEVTDELLKSKWTLREGPIGSTPGKLDDALEDLPMVRLRPPDNQSGDWFLELLSAPPDFQPGTTGKKLRRIHTDAGDFAICSFDYLALAEWRPLATPFDLKIARPQMMALANLLHHPYISETLISDTDYKRSNKDLGRVIALSYLTMELDRAENRDDFSEWAQTMWLARQDKFGEQAAELALRAGDGMRALRDSATDFDQALRIANLGLLASMDVSRAAFRATTERVLAEVLEELSELARTHVRSRPRASN